MTLQSVRDFLLEHAPDVEVVEMASSTATVQEAAEANGVTAGQIAKTLSLKLKDEVILLLIGGDRKIDNRKYRDQFGCRATMLSAEEVSTWTGHPVGGVCPLGLPIRLRIFADITIKKFDTIVLAAGSTNATLRIGSKRLVQLVQSQWVDVAQEAA